jgi:Tol biopolymer transport system component
MSPERIRWAAALLALCLIGVAVVAGSGAGGDGSSSSDSQAAPAAEVSTPSVYSNIYVVDVDNRVAYLLTGNRNKQFAESPSWSRAGGIVFSEPTCAPCSSRLFAIEGQWERRKRLHSDVGNLFQPDWSPDARRVAAAKPGAGVYSIAVADGSARRLSDGESDGAPSWSPDGDMIVFHRQMSATNWDIFGVSPDGGSLRRLTRDSRQQVNPTWSPDGAKIAFAEQRPNGNWAIFSMNLDGSERRQLTDESDSSQDPAWSPDGARIAFIAQREGRTAIAVVDAEGGERRFLTDRSLAASGPAWSPDGEKIVFAAQEIRGGVHH